MPIEWAIAFLGTIVACAYFSYQHGMEYGVTTATLLTLSKLEDEGLIIFEENGNIKAGKGEKNFAEEYLENERNGE
jgi:hypothetical protein